MFCSGKVYFDLLKARRKEALRDVALVRIEQLYPFPSEEYQAMLDRYPNAREVVWCQEEPQNQGAWYQIRHRLQELALGAARCCTRGAPRPAAPATGIAKIHELEQQALVAAALHSNTTEERRDHDAAAAAIPGAACRPPLATCRRRSKELMSTEIRVPQLPESVADATLVAWHKQPGEAIRRDENLADLETDKVVLEVPAPANGVVREMRVQSGTVVTSGQVLAVIEEGAVAPAAQPVARRRRQRGCRDRTAAAAGRCRAKPRRRWRGAREPASSAPRCAGWSRRTSSTPGAIPASGRDGRLTKSDVVEYLEQEGRAGAPPCRGTGCRRGARSARRGRPRAGRPRAARAPSSACR